MFSLLLTVLPIMLACLALLTGKSWKYILSDHNRFFAAMLAYKTVSGTKGFKKLVHLVLQFLAFSLSIIGLWAAWKFHVDKGIDNFYSLHSWLGLACFLLFGIQVVILTSLVPPLLQRRSRV